MSRRRTSYAAPAWAAEQATGDVGTKAVLMVLARYADDRFSCFPGQAQIAEETEQSVRTVRRQLERLAELCLIERTHRYDERGKRTSDRYVLRVDADSPLEDTLSASTTGQIGATTGHQRSPLPDTAVAEELPENYQGELRARATPPPDPSTARCPDHAGWYTPPACGGCAAARQAADTLARKARSTADAEQRQLRAAAERDRLAAIAACRICNPRGRADGLLCRHDRGRNDNIRRAAAAAQQAKDALRVAVERRTPAAAQPADPGVPAQGATQREDDHAHV